jgi:hypothetical protein
MGWMLNSRTLGQGEREPPGWGHGQFVLNHLVFVILMFIVEKKKKKKKKNTLGCPSELTN